MKKSTLILALITLSIIMFSCGGGNESTSSQNEIQETKTTQEKPSEPKMTVEKAAHLDYELAALLMDNYWEKFEGKKYAEIKDLYSKYYKQQKEIYRKYGVTKEGWNQQQFVYWGMDHKKELKAFRKAHPEYDFYTKYPNYRDALMGLYKLNEESWKDKK